MCMNRRSQRVLIIVLLILIIFLQLAVIYTSFNKQKAAGISLNQEAVYYIQAAAKKVIPAVVYIEAIDKSGSGSIISNDGYIITNSHVVSDSSNITVRLSDKRIFKAKLIGSDPQTDVALLKINAEYLTAMEFGDSDAVDVGDNVIAIGNPFGFDFTVTTGIISAKHRERGPTEYRDFLQTDASINPGNSGGPLIKMDRLVIYGKVERSYLGVSLQDKISLDNENNGRILDGSEIVSLDSKGPAINSGFKIGDMIISINGQKLTDSNQLRNYIALLPVGEEINVTVLRGGKDLTFKLKTALRPTKF